MIFFHGLGEGGNGTTDLYEVLGNGPPEIVNTPSHPLYNLFEDEDVIMLAPQVTNNTWWNENHIRPFLDFALSHYRIDPRRIYFTGLSAGSSGIHQFINDDPNARQITAAMTVAVRGTINSTSGSDAASTIPYWALTAIADASSTATNSVNRIAQQISGQPSNVMGNYPTGTSQTHTASFDADAGTWEWNEGVVASFPNRPHPKYTLYPGSSHNTWDRTYDNIDCWNWLLSQVKPAIILSDRTRNRVLNSGQSINLEADVFDQDDLPLPSATLSWSSNLAGSLGTGSPLPVSGLGIGVHEISASFTDSEFRQSIVETNVTVLRSGAYRVLFDFGHGDYPTAGNWNQLTDRIAGVVSNAIADDGTTTGVTASIIDRFDAIQTGGVLANDVYPETAQRDTMFVSANFPQARIRFGGLNPNQTYSITLFASRTASNDRSGVYTLNGQSMVLNAQNNSDQTITFDNVFPTTLGELLLTVERNPGATWAYLGVVEIVTDGVVADSDHLSNRWELAQFGNLLQNPEDDFDLDGLSNELEFAQGSLANDPSSRAAQHLGAENTGSGAAFSFTYTRLADEPFVFYQVLGSNNLINWLPVDLQFYDVSITPIANTEPALEEVTLTPTSALVPSYLKLEVSAAN